MTELLKLRLSPRGLSLLVDDAGLHQIVERVVDVHLGVDQDFQVPRIEGLPHDRRNRQETPFFVRESIDALLNGLLNRPRE